MNFIIGGLMFLLCAFIGFKIANNYKRKLQFITDFKTLLDYLETNILYLQDTLEKLIRDKMESFHSDFKNFLKSYLQNLQNSTEFLEKWLKEQNLIDTETAEIIKKFMLELGRQDSTAQLQSIIQTNEILAKHTERAQGEQKKGYMSARLGIMGGLALFIIII